MDAQLKEPPADRAVAELAGRQHGVVARAQLEALGFSRTEIQGRVARRWLHRVHRGVYAVGHLALTRNGLFMAAVLACGDGAALSHFSAAVLWGILDVGGPVHVTAERQRTCRGVVVHHGPLQGERLRREGIVVTTPARTLVDLADVVTRRRTLERAFDEAEYLRLDWQSAAPRPGRRGSGLLASVLAAHEPGSTRTLSELEELFLAFCDKHGFRRPEVNSSIEGSRRARERDPIRDAELQLAGWIVMRVPYMRLLNGPDAVAAQVGRALKQAPAAPASPHRP
jgi:Transcriptional regulator, AbiEi antitoxin